MHLFCEVFDWKSEPLNCTFLNGVILGNSNIKVSMETLETENHSGDTRQFNNK